jgi:hypothetical protein
LGLGQAGESARKRECEKHFFIKLSPELYC